MKLSRSWRKTRCTLCRLFFNRFRGCHDSVKRRLCSTAALHTPPEAKKICRLKLKPPVRPLRRIASKLKRNPTNELERLKRKGDNWTANDLFRFQHGNLNDCNAEQKRAICLEWLRRVNNIPKKYCYLAWYASAIYTCYHRLAPLLVDKTEKKRIWMDVKREYAEIFLMGRRIWRRPTHPTRLRILYDLAMLCVCFNDVPNDDTIVLFRDLLDDYNTFNFEVLNEIEYAQSIDKTVRLENHVIDLFYQRRRSTGSSRSSFRSKCGSETPRSSFRSFTMKSDMKSDDLLEAKLRKASSLSAARSLVDVCTIRDLQPSASGSQQLVRKPSVRFAEESDLDDIQPEKETLLARENEEQTDVNTKNATMKVKITSLDVSENSPVEVSDHAETELPSHYSEHVIVTVTTATSTTIDKEMSVCKTSDNAKTIRVLPCRIWDKVYRSIAGCPVNDVLQVVTH